MVTELGSMRDETGRARVGEYVSNDSWHSFNYRLFLSLLLFQVISRVGKGSEVLGS